MSRTDPSSIGISRWGWLALYAACAAVMLTSLGRYLPPAGDRFIDLLKPGSADLIPSVNAANALIEGKNPYRTPDSFVVDPYAASRGSNEGISYLYPPSHALLYVPIVYLAHGDYAHVQRLQFVLELACLVAIAIAVAWLLGDMLVLDGGALLAMASVVCLLLGLNVGNQLGIERGQSDVVTAALGWWALVAFQRRWLVFSAFLCTASVLLKGYGIVFAVGLIAIAMRLSWRRTMLGATAAIALLFVPVARYLPDSIAAYRIRSAMFWSSWTNQSFANLAHYVGVPREQGRITFAVAALACTVAAWSALSRRVALEHDRSGRAFWGTVFATASFSTVLGYSLNCIAYSCIITMPGVLVLALAQERLVIQNGTVFRACLGMCLVASVFALFVFDIDLALGRASKELPLNAAGGVAVLCTIGAAAVVETARSSRRAAKLVWVVGAAFAVGVSFQLLWPLLLDLRDGPDLADGRPWTASSIGIRCEPASRNCGGRDRGVFFHTDLETSPWLRIDLGSNTEVSTVKIHNRRDCCSERAVPLLIELSNDGLSWRQVSRREDPFYEWRASFEPQIAKYVRMRVERRSVLHFEHVSVHGTRASSVDDSGEASR